MESVENIAGHSFVLEEERNGGREKGREGRRERGRQRRRETRRGGKEKGGWIDREKRERERYVTVGTVSPIYAHPQCTHLSPCIYPVVSFGNSSTDNLNLPHHI